jgi:hypothetical protein
MVAERVAEAVRRKYGPQIQAIGVHGSVAHGDDADGSDVDIVVVTRRSANATASRSRRVDGVIVDLGVIGAEEYLREARTLGMSWPLAADQYLTTRALHDPDRYLHRLRDAHLGRLAQTGATELAGLARQAWYEARSAHGQARRLAEAYDTDAALFALGEARLSAALVEGLLARTYFRNRPDAIRQTGFGTLDVPGLDARLQIQARDLEKRGCPVDGDVEDLLS